MVCGLCPASVRVAIISEPVEQIPFKFQLYVALGLNQGGNGHFEKNHIFSSAGLCLPKLLNCEISNFGFLANFFVLFGMFNMVVNGE